MNFNEFIRSAQANGDLVVQPRMGFASQSTMRQGLLAVKACNAATVGTITLDSYTRVGDISSAQLALDSGQDLNGYPIVNYGAKRNREMLCDVVAPHFPIQVRHGSPLPKHIFEAIAESGLNATEGGPVSYCLPYSRTPLTQAVAAWRDCTRFAAAGGDAGQIHIESFGGCMLGQMCPPSLLVAISLLEGMFFEREGLYEISFSYAQQTSPSQDIGAVKALRRLAAKWIKRASWHVVLYTYMGVFPRTAQGALDLLKRSVDVCKAGGAERLIVKTIAEAIRIPTVQENILSLETSTQHWRHGHSLQCAEQENVFAEDIFNEAQALIEAVVQLDSDIGEALIKAFDRGLLDVPYCLHQDNAGKSRAVIDEQGALGWLTAGRMPVKTINEGRQQVRLDPFNFLTMLSTVERRYDGPYINLKNLSEGKKHAIA